MTIRVICPLRAMLLALVVLAPVRVPASPAVPAAPAPGKVSVAGLLRTIGEIPAGAGSRPRAFIPPDIAPPRPGQVSVAELLRAAGDIPRGRAPAPKASEPRDVAAARPARIAPPGAPGLADDIAPEPEPEKESDVAAKARAGAAAMASRDTGAGKALSTADIVAESEPSVALVKGKGSSGTGFLVGPGLLVTNSHVIDDEFIGDLEVRFVSADEPRKAPIKAELLYEDGERDLAFLAVKTDLKPLRVASRYTFRKGEDVTVIGNPGIGDGQVLENAINRGVMSTRTQIGNRGFYQLGISINPGNSGGPVFDSSGRVIGVVTLKAATQEATGFCVPIEDVQGALLRLSKETAAQGDGYRSRHRAKTAVKGLGGGGALMCLMIDLRRAAALSNAAAREILDKLEPMCAELEKGAFSSLETQAPRVRHDRLIDQETRRKVAEMTENFARIRDLYSSKENLGNGDLRSWKATHKRLITDLWSALGLEVPDGMMLAFDDHAPARPNIFTLGPEGFGLSSPRLRQRYFGGGFGPDRRPGGIPRPPSLRDRMRRGGVR